MSGEPDGAPFAFTVLTGWLGAGKTTVLNRVLGVLGERRVAVLVNELGRIAIDGRLILSQGGDVLELAGGCVCCKIDVKNDLWDGIADVVARSRPDHVVLETTGIAEPEAILAGLARLPAALVERLVPAGVVCVVDGEAGAQALDRREEARAQVACADRLILSKLDRAGPAELAAVHGRLDALGSGAERASFPAGEVADRALAGYLLEVRTPVAPGAPQHGHHHRHGQLTAVAIVDEAPLFGEALLAVIERWRPRLHRVKGFVYLAGDHRRGFLELAGAALDLTPGAPWASGEPRKSELVLIGDDLDEAALRRQLAACRTAG
jgi:G3E family GTPase